MHIFAITVTRPQNVTFIQFNVKHFGIKYVMITELVTLIRSVGTRRIVYDKYARQITAYR